MKTTVKKRVAVIGAGIAGLSCATRLQALGFEVEVFEKSRGPSGRMRVQNKAMDGRQTTVLSISLRAIPFLNTSSALG